MNDTRARFEEIWPVPEGVYWNSEASAYWTNNHTYEDSMDEWNSRLDTFTRCQETTEVYVSLVDELIKELEWSYAGLEACEIDHGSEVLSRAKQIMEQNK